MIISASRRTDIPAYYSEWMVNRIKEGYVFVKNPMNIHQISNIKLTPDIVDCIVFWSKNPKPLFEKLHVFTDYAYYFQFTLNPYDKDIEPILPMKGDIIDTFRKLSELIGSHRVIWRYDPVLLNSRYSISYHIDKFADLACKLRGSAKSVTFSFIDFYKKITENIKVNGIDEITIDEKIKIAENFSKSAKENNLRINTCAENIDLSKYNIKRARCIDDRLIAKITGYNINVDKDKNQRLECGCVGSIDIGEYNSCDNGCIYCYANYSKNIVENNIKNHNNFSPMLIGEVNGNSVITERKVVSNKMQQQELF